MAAAGAQRARWVQAAKFSSLLAAAAAGQLWARRLVDALVETVVRPVPPAPLFAVGAVAARALAAAVLRAVEARRLDAVLRRLRRPRLHTVSAGVRASITGQQWQSAQVALRPAVRAAVRRARIFSAAVAAAVATAVAAAVVFL